MRVIQVMGMRSNKYGGLERFMVALSGQLQGSGSELILVYESMPSSTLYLEKLKQNKVRILVFPARGTKAFSFAFRFATLLVRCRPDVVHCHFDPAGYIASVLSFFMFVKCRVRSFHSMIDRSDHTQVESLRDLSLKTRILKRMSYMTSNRIYAVSDGVATQFGRLFDRTDKIERLYLGVDSNDYSRCEMRAKYNLPSDVLVITCVAFHGSVKGVDVLLEAIKILVEDYPDNKFLLCQVGVGTDTAKLHQYARDNKIESYVNWMGLQDNVPEILAASDIYVQPSRSEAVSLSLMEASMAGLPLLASDVGGVAEVVTDGVTGLLIEADNAPILAEKLNILLHNPTLRSNFGKAAKLRAMEYFNINVGVELMIQGYSVGKWH